MNTTWIKLTFNTKTYFFKQHLFRYQGSNYTIKEYWTMWLHIKGTFIHLCHLIFHRNGVIQLKQFITYSAGIWHILHMQIRGKWIAAHSIDMALLPQSGSQRNISTVWYTISARAESVYGSAKNQYDTATSTQYTWFPVLLSVMWLYTMK